MELVSRERSYRIERAGCGTFALVCSTPFVYGASAFGYTWWMWPPGHEGELWKLVETFDWSTMSNPALMFMILFFFAYRAHSKLTLIRHIKHHLNPDKEEL